MLMKPFIIAMHIILLTQAFDMSIFNRLELKVCRGEQLPLGCQENDVLWVHEAFAGFNPFSLSAKGDVHICAVDDKDCRDTLAATEPVFRATSMKPHYVVTVLGGIRCLYSIIGVGITYKRIHYSCIQKELLDTIPMFSSVTRVTNTVHIQLASLPEDDGVGGEEVMCLIHASAGHVIGMTFTMVYIDLPRASPCSQQFWANDQDDIKLVSFCSPVWLRQHTLYQGSVSKVALHFKSTPVSSSTVQQSNDDTQPEASLFLWLYIAARESFTVTCGQHPGIPTLSPTHHVIPATDSEPRSSLPTQPPSPAPTHSTPEPCGSTLCTSPTSHHAEPSHVTLNPTTYYTTRQVKEQGPSRLPTQPNSSVPTRNTSEPSSSTLGTSPPPPRHDISTSAKQSPATDRTTYHSAVQVTEPTTELPTNNISQSIAGQVNSPETDTPNVDAAPPNPSKWETAVICMGVAMFAILFVVGLISVRQWGKARRQALLQREEEMPYDPPIFHTHLPDSMERHQSQYLNVDAADPSWQENPHLYQRPGIEAREFLVMAGSIQDNDDRLFTSTEPTYASIPM